jgi:hypothetical protein
MATLGGYGGVQGQAFGPASGHLFGLDVVTHELVSIDPATRQATPIGGTCFLSTASTARATA